MLSEDAIDNLVQPIIDRQESINIMTIQTIAERIGEIGTLTPADINRLKLLVQMGVDIRLLNEEIARLTDLQVSDIKKVIKTVALDSYIDAKPLYDYRHKSFIPFAKNTELQKIVSAMGRTTAGTYKNLANSKATGFMMYDPKNPKVLKFQSIKDTYKSAIDQAIQSTKSGVNKRSAINRVLKQLVDSGVRRMYWDSGYTQRLDTAVRRNIYDGIHALQQAVEDEIAEQIGADAKELSVHINSALDHEPIQGHVFTNVEYNNLQSGNNFHDINGNTFDGIERAIGMWNCRHFAYAFVIGVSKPRYTDKQLQRFIQKNHEGYTLPNGKHLTMYECTQMQRQLETRIRYAKEEQMAFQAAKNLDSARLARKKVVQLTNEYKIFSKNCGLKTAMDRTFVPNYRAIKYN